MFNDLYLTNLSRDYAALQFEIHISWMTLLNRLCVFLTVPRTIPLPCRHGFQEWRDRSSNQHPLSVFKRDRCGMKKAFSISFSFFTRVTKILFDGVKMYFVSFTKKFRYIKKKRKKLWKYILLYICLLCLQISALDIPCIEGCSMTNCTLRN